MKAFSTDTKAFIQAHCTEDIRQLALQSQRYPLVDMPAAITQIAGLQTAKEKLPSWNRCKEIRYPQHLSLEQCSSEATARYKAELVQGETFADLTGGFGVDTVCIAQNHQSGHYVERQEVLCELAQHNFPLFGLTHVEIHQNEAVAFLKNMTPVDTLFIDPARRNEHGGKTVAIADCEPDIAALEEELVTKGRRVLIKLSPMLDVSLALKTLRYVRAVHVVSVGNECKELLFVLEQTQQEAEEITIHCANLTPQGIQRYAFTREQESIAACPYTSDIERYLFEPNAAILKAGAYRSLAETFQLKKLHPNSHLYTSCEPIKGFPGRTFQVIGTCSFNKKEVKETLGALPKANLTVRNFPNSVSELRKRLKLADGGEDYLFATTLQNEQKTVIHCRKANF